jgi:hypothetical protein
MPGPTKITFAQMRDSGVPGSWSISLGGSYSRCAAGRRRNLVERQTSRSGLITCGRYD